MNYLDQITIYPLKKEDISLFKKLIYLFEDVFIMENFDIPNDPHLENLLNKNDFHAIVAIHNNEIVGGLTAYTLQQYYSIKPLAYIFDLAVAVQFQRQNVGTQLINYSKEYFKEIGYEEVFVQADKVDDYAVKFYRKTKPTVEEDVSHFYYVL
ncbi:GNAT family N-acetyltransferase [Flavobacterium sp. UMI-01]|uniref:GNAT family N-acetyltransferase n=1 Tax=Flavobacterium sp. UMI-01 TaxID=1441053 RepID=UPI001C7DC95A|nr:GNAT family N-acetyltransferase [Flavobacterium sp. UMI-01]GIZ09042.1 hypothetical protein FUMI01_17690 [Flavobacterium sp. UMI-01]